jgi:hypothetical protein
VTVSGQTVVIIIISSSSITTSVGGAQEHLAGFCECDNEPSGLIKWGEFLE